ncbi:sporulation protein [Aliikangiella coralliicola]|uniref:Sporulation protein n=1 Tax=Aliikangiella coralliicola TaxID=2592383 RepID=A0A545UFT2_9GAMM|nr:sporulation protein [Aliikangiella coralliicola]TQV88330.1 sporulation protein [Aliikangiella coralliicola]
MSFFKKALSKVGVGAAKVDTLLDNAIVYPGGELSGVIKVKGGNVAQSIKKIDLDVRCNYMTEIEVDEETNLVERTATLVAYDLEAFEIQPDEEKEIPFCIEMPETSPLTLGHSKTWVETNLDIEFALDKSDKDYVRVEPNELQHEVLRAIEEMGFVLVEAECEAVKNFHVPFMQELEFKARSGAFARRVSEIEVVFINEGDQLRILLEIDRKARGIKGLFLSALDLNETKTSIIIDENNATEAGNILEEVIGSYC